MAFRPLDPLRLPDGRHLALGEVGDPDGRVAFYFHGTGSSRLEVGHLEDAARAHGIRLVAWDRPGSGHSTPQEHRRLTSVVDDARAVAATLGVGRVAVLGHSGGGSHVLALTVTAPDLVTLGVAINPGPPSDDVHLADLPSQMSGLIRTARDRPRLFAIVTRAMEIKGGPVGEALRTRTLPDSDRAVVAGPGRVLFEAAAAEGSRQPHAYGTEAAMLWHERWGFGLDSLGPPLPPLHVFSGDEDPFRPFCRRLEAAGATLHEYAGGHVSCFVPTVLDEVLGVARAAAGG